MRYILMLLAVLTVTLPCAGQEAQPITFANSGYTIEALDPGLSKSGALQSMIMFLPEKDGFASNVNIQHQAFAGTLQDYSALSKTQFEKGSWTIVNETIDDFTYTTEAIGQPPGADKELHFYFRAIKSGGNVILATATVPQARWDEEKTKLIQIVDSLKPLN